MRSKFAQDVPRRPGYRRRIVNPSLDWRQAWDSRWPVAAPAWPITGCAISTTSGDRHSGQLDEISEYALAHDRLCEPDAGTPRHVRKVMEFVAPELCEGGHGQRRNRGRAVHDAWAGRAYGNRPGPGGRCRPLHFTTSWPPGGQPRRQCDSRETGGVVRCPCRHFIFGNT